MLLASCIYWLLELYENIYIYWDKTRRFPQNNEVIHNISPYKLKHFYYIRGPQRGLGKKGEIIYCRSTREKEAKRREQWNKGHFGNQRT